jgi:predicted nucleic acid-binding protein
VPLLLDTTVLIDALRGRRAGERLLALRSGGEVPYVSCINIEEVWRGMRPAEREQTERLLDALRVADLGAAEAKRAGEWRRRFAERGITLSQADCLVASAAVGVGARLATGNPKDFPMEELEVDHWHAGV